MNDLSINQIPEISNAKQIVQINKGFSADEKYLIHMLDDSKKLFLRTFDLSQFEAKKLEYSILKKMQDYEVACPKPVAIGKMKEKGYMVLSYIKGTDAEKKIASIPYEEQFAIGFKAGKELRKMHQLTAPEYIASWYSRKVEKHEKYIKAYLTCGIKIKNDEKIVKFINDNIHLMKQRPNLFLHDDFHLGNLIVKDKQFAGVIDFDRFDWGDPYHEFLKNGIFSRGISTHFSIGQIKGYFDDKEPDEAFWRLYSLYLAMCVFSSLIWTLNTIPDDIDNALDRIYMLLEDHDYFSSIKPKWYE